MKNKKYWLKSSDKKITCKDCKKEAKMTSPNMQRCKECSLVNKRKKVKEAVIRHYKNKFGK